MKRWFLLLLLAAPTSAAIRYVEGDPLKPEDRSAINQNFRQIEERSRNYVNKTSTETIRGPKYFSNSVTFAGARPWRDIMAPEYGAKCDGTDDTAAIQAAINATNTSQPETVFVPPGCTFHIYSTLTINRNNLAFLGGAQNGSIIQSHFDGPAVTLNSAAGALSYINIKDIEFDSVDTGTNTIGILLTGANAINLSNFENIHIRGFYTGIKNTVTAADYGHNHFSNLRMDNYGANSIYFGFRYTGGHTVGEIISNNSVIVSSYSFHMVDGGAGSVGIGDIVIVGNYFSNGINCVYLEGNTARYHHNFRIVGNQFIDSSSYPVVMKAVAGSTVFGNTFALGATTLDPVFQDANCDTNLIDTYAGGLGLGGKLMVGVHASTANYTAQFRSGTDKNLLIDDGVSITGAVSLEAVNNAASNNTPLEIRASSTSITAGPLFITQNTEPYLKFTHTTSTPSAVSTIASIWAVNVDSQAEIKVRDGGGTITQISAHNAGGNWIFTSENPGTGKKVYIDMERFIHDMEDKFGTRFLFETQQEAEQYEAANKK